MSTFAIVTRGRTLYPAALEGTLIYFHDAYVRFIFECTQVFKRIDSEQVENETDLSRIFAIEAALENGSTRLWWFKTEHYGITQVTCFLFFMIKPVNPEITHDVKFYRVKRLENDALGVTCISNKSQLQPLIKPSSQQVHIANQFASFYRQIKGEEGMLKDIGLENLKRFILTRGQNNRISISDDDQDTELNFEEVKKALPLFKHHKDRDWAVVLLNNVMSYEVRDGQNCYLVKQKRNCYTQTGVKAMTSCIHRYKDASHVKGLFKGYELKWKKDDGKEMKETWFNIWDNSKKRALITGGVEFEPYPITQSNITLDQSLESLDEYVEEKQLNMFSGYTWTKEDLEQCYHSEKGKRSIEEIRRILFHVISDSSNQVYDFLIEFLAHIVQYPGKKLLFVPYVKGQKGIGKSLLLFTPFQQLYHHHTVYLAGQGVNDDFNGRLRDGVILMNLDEFPQSHKHTQTFKSMITQPYMNVRAMYSETETVPNRMNFIITTNHYPSSHLEITKDERRFFLIEAAHLTDKELTEHKKKLTNLYQECLWDDGKKTGLKAFIWWLLQQKINTDEPMENRIPITALFRRTIENTMTVAERFIKRCIERGGIKPIHRPNDVVEYDWDYNDTNNEWTWTTLLDELYKTFPDMAKSRKRSEIIDDMKTLFVVKDTGGSTNKRKTVFQLADRETHYRSFRKLWPNLNFNWEKQKLIIDDDPFVRSMRAAEQQNPELKEIDELTDTWDKRDFNLAIYELKKELEVYKKQVKLNKRARDQEENCGADMALRNKVRRVMVTDPEPNLNKNPDSPC